MLAPMGAFEGGMDLGEHAADPVRDAVDFAGQVVVEPNDHSQVGDEVIVAADASQRVGHGAAGLSDDERVTGVGFRVARVEISDAAHRQPGQIGDLDTHRSSDGHRQCPDRGGLVHDHQHRPMDGELVEHLAQGSLVLGQGLVMQTSPGAVERGGMVVFLAYIEADEYVEPVLVHDSPP